MLLLSFLLTSIEAVQQLQTSQQPSTTTLSETHLKKESQQEEINKIPVSASTTQMRAPTHGHRPNDSASDDAQAAQISVLKKELAEIKLQHEMLNRAYAELRRCCLSLTKNSIPAHNYVRAFAMKADQAKIERLKNEAKQGVKLSDLLLEIEKAVRPGVVTTTKKMLELFGINPDSSIVERSGARTVTYGCTVIPGTSVSELDKQTNVLQHIMESIAVNDDTP
mgnify:FL=1